MKNKNGRPDGILLRCHEGDGRPHGGGGDDDGAILDDGDRVSQAVHCFRRGLQELDEEPVEFAICLQKLKMLNSLLFRLL